jgi:beta-N-acetylhexosaminidase
MDAQRGVARRMVIGLPREGLSPRWEKDFAAYPPAGVILFARDFADLGALREITTRLRDLARPRRIFTAVDEEGGFVSQLAGHLIVPPNAGLLARGAEPGDIEWAARVTGERLRGLGIDWVFAPVADIHSEPRNPVIGPRAFGSDARAVGGAVAQALAGFRSARVATCLKHFPGHGDTVLDSHLALPRCNASAAVLAEREVLPFSENLTADSVMTAHVVYPAMDAERPATFSRTIVHDLLRGRLGFEGVTITDALEMRGAAEGVSPAESALRALEAGCDLLLFAFHDEGLRRARLELADLLVEGRIDRELFDQARPRLAGFDRAVPEPSSEDLSRPLESLTPTDWVPRLERIVERGLRSQGSLPPGPAGGPWRVSEPAFPHGPSLAEELSAQGVRVAEAPDPALELVAVTTRTPLPEAEVERLRALCHERPTVLLGLQSDAFLDQLPEAALRVSAADATPLTRRVVARFLSRRMRDAMSART